VALREKTCGETLIPKTKLHLVIEPEWQARDDGKENDGNDYAAAVFGDVEPLAERRKVKGDDTVGAHNNH